MSGILDLVQQSLGGDAVQRISQQLGADPQQAQSAIGAALPMLLAGMAHHSQEGGADAMHAAVSQHDGGLLDNLGALLGGAPTQTNTGAGGLLDLVLGQHTDTAHAAVAGASGLQTAQVQQLLAMLAPVVMSAVARTSQQQGLDSSGLAGLLQGEHQQVAQSMGQSQPGLLGLAQSLLGGAPGNTGGAGSPLDGLAKELGGLLGGN